MIRRALGGVLALVMAALASPAAAQGDFVTHYRGILAGYANQSNGYVDFYRLEHGYYARLAASPSLTGNITWRLPVSYGAGSCIKDDGGGNMYVGSCGIGDLVAGNNLSELTATASTARANIGAQASHASLTALAGLTYGADKCTYWSSSSAAATFDCTSYGRGLIGVADAAAARSAMGLGTMATQASSSVSITGGSIAGITDLAVSDGGTGASTASIARTNLGVAVGQDVQAQNANLQALADLTYAASKCTYWSSSSAAATFDCSSYGRSLIGVADATAARTAMGLGSLATLSVAPTATALAANGTNCSAGSYPLGVDASGNSESCTVAPSGLTVSTTTIASGGAGKILYDTGGTLGASSATISSGGTVTLPAGQKIANSGGSNSYLQVSDAAGTILAYGGNTIGMGAAAVTTTSGTAAVAVSTSGIALTQGGFATTLVNDGSLGISKLVSGNDVQIMAGSGQLYQGSVALAESATTSLVIPVASGAGTGGRISYTVFASDGTDHQARSGSVRFAVVNKAGTETCAVYGADSSFTANPIETQDGSSSGAITSGTLTYAWSADTAASNSCSLKINPVSSLTQTTFRIDLTVILTGPGAISVP